MRWMDPKVRPLISGEIVYRLLCIASIGSMFARNNSLHLRCDLDLSLPHGSPINF